MSGPALLCYDGSEQAAAAIARAGELLRVREALVLSVAVPAQDAFPLDPLGDAVGRLSSVYRQWDDIGAEVAERQARSGCEVAARAGLRAGPLSASGRPAETILRLAREHDACVIVLGGRRHSALGSLLGSVTARVLHDADRPVLVLGGSS